MNHLREAEFLARECIEQVIDLLPDGEAMPTASDARLKGLSLLQNIRAIQQELRSVSNELSTDAGAVVRMEREAVQLAAEGPVTQ